jgi:hypothetical protein
MFSLARVIFLKLKTLVILNKSSLINKYYSFLFYLKNSRVLWKRIGQSTRHAEMFEFESNLMRISYLLIQFDRVILDCHNFGV